MAEFFCNVYKVANSKCLLVLVMESTCFDHFYCCFYSYIMLVKLDIYFATVPDCILCSCILKSIYCPHLSYQTFIGRFRRTMDSSQNAYNEDTSALVERLDCLERSLFKAGQSGLNSFQLWEKGRSSHLTASSLVINYRKRKMTDLQA